MKNIRQIAWGLVAGALIALVFAGRQPAYEEVDTIPSVTKGPGGPFTLTSHRGEKVSDSDFRGRHMLIYFGYSFCPDVCPMELQKMTVALNKLEERGLDTTSIQPLFITIDPERDTVDQLASYMSNFHERFIGLTGSMEAIEKLAKDYRVYFAKRESEEMADYLMDHSSVIFLMKDDGNYGRIFTSKDSLDDLENTLALVIERSRPPIEP